MVPPSAGYSHTAFHLPRPRDPIQLGKLIVDIATGQTKDETDDDFVVKPYNPKEDYQVREAINYLRGFDVFKKMSVQKPTAQNTGN